MQMVTILAPEAIVLDMKINSKKQLLNQLAEKMEELSGIDQYAICNMLNEREKLGSTGVGNGVAIPHGRLEEATRIHGIFATLDAGIPFDSVDNIPVDLVFMLLVPEECGSEHLRVLAKISRLFRDHNLCEKLRGCHDAEAAYVLLTEEQPKDSTA